MTLLAITYLYRSLPLLADSFTDIYVLDVGQGDGIFIRTADGENILVDGGPNAGIVSELASRIPAWDQSIDLVVLTHAHADHVGGLTAVANHFPILQVWYSGAEYDSNIYREFIETVKQKHIALKEVAMGEVQSFAHSSIRIIGPSSVKPTDTDPNEASIVAIFNQADFDLLLTGDMTSNNERVLVDQGRISDTDVLKVAHHGSRTSSSDLFIDASKPELAIISAGLGNTYGHPHPETLARYAARHIPVLRTDQMGTIHLITDGSIYKVLGQHVPNTP